MTSRFTGLWQHPDFLKFWAGQTISVIGSSITSLALPIIATVTLDATPEQMGLLAATGQVAYLLIGLPAGAWVDRMKRRPVMIIADIGRTVCLALVPLTAVLGMLRMEYLYVIALITGVMTVFFELAYLAFVPVLVTRGHVEEANSKLETSRSAAQIVGPGLAGALVQALGAPMALIVDALTFAASAISLMLVRTEEAAPEASGTRPALRTEIAEGVRVVLHNPLLRALILGTALFNFFAMIVEAIWVLFMVRELGLEPVQIGLIASMAGPSTLLGALMARRITQRVGIGRAVVGSLLMAGSVMILRALAQPPSALAMGMIAVGDSLFGACVMIFNINVLSLRQSITPDRLLGRVSATMRFAVLGIIPLGSLAGGFIAGQIGLRPTLLIGVAGSVLAAALLLLTPVPKLKQTEQAITEYAVE